MNDFTNFLSPRVNFRVRILEYIFLTPQITLKMAKLLKGETIAPRW